MGDERVLNYLMAKYGKAAIEATDRIRQKGDSPPDAWLFAVKRLYPHQKAAREKGCPRNAYLGLCEEGIINGVAAGKYTKSLLNKQYALNAVQLLRSDPSQALNKEHLWNKIQKGNKKAENNQLDVVLALWENGLIINI